MNIIYIADSIIPSMTANSIHVMQMCQAYADNGCNVTLIVPNRKNLQCHIADDVFDYYGVQNKFKLIKIPLPSIRSSFIYFSIILPIIAMFFRPKFVHTRSILVAFGLTKIFKINTILEMHSDHGIDSIYFRKAVNSRNCIAVVTITKSLANKLIQKYPNINIHVAPDGVDERRVSKEHLKTISQIPKILYTGSFYKGRGVEILIELAKELVGWNIEIAGGGEDEVMRYRVQCENLKNIHFHGHVPPKKINDLLKSADILIMPYDGSVKAVGGSDITKYTSPMKLFEYLACGKPIIASKLPVLGEILVDQYNCVMVQMGNIKEIVSACKKLQIDNLLFEKISMNSLKTISEYTWQKRSNKILNLVLSNIKWE